MRSNFFKSRALFFLLSFSLLFHPTFLLFSYGTEDVTDPLLSSLSQSPLSEPEFMGEYQIGGNDLLQITVAEEEDLTQEIRVTTSGFISFPLLGRIHVAGKTVTELEDFVREALAKDYIRDPRVRIVVKEFSNVFVLGQIEKSGPLSFKGGMTVLQAITTAGGFTKLANRRKVRIVRGSERDKEVIYANVAQIAAGKAEDIFLQPGDTVVVSESFF